MKRDQINDEIRQLLDGQAIDAELADPRVDEAVRDWVSKDDSHGDIWLRLQDLDTQIADAFEEVDVPAGLAERLKENISVKVIDATGGPNLDRCLEDGSRDKGAKPYSKSTSATGRAPNGSTWMRRHRYWLVSSAACVIALFGIVYASVVHQSIPSVVSREQLGHGAIQWTSKLDQDTWNMVAPGTSHLRICSDLHAQPVRWQTVETRYDGHCVVVDMTPPGEKMIIQFTLRSGEDFEVDPFMPSVPIYKTANHCVGACKQDGVVFVVVVEGDLSRYRQVVQRQLPFL